MVWVSLSFFNNFQVLQYGDSLTNLEHMLVPFESSESVTAKAICDAFKVKPEKLQRARVLSTVKRFGKLAAAGFASGDILLQQHKSKCELFLVNEAKPFQMDLKTATQGNVYVARAIPAKQAATLVPTATTAYREPRVETEAMDVEENETKMETDEKGV